MLVFRWGLLPQLESRLSRDARIAGRVKSSATVSSSCLRSTRVIAIRVEPLRGRGVSAAGAGASGMPPYVGAADVAER